MRRSEPISRGLFLPGIRRMLIGCSLVALVAVAPLGHGAMAQEDQNVATVSEMLQDVLAKAATADAATTAEAKRAAYEAARKSFLQLQQIAELPVTLRPDQAPDDAKVALGEIARHGLSADILTDHEFDASLVAFKARPNDDANVASLVDLDALIHDMSQPRDRLNALVELADATTFAQSRSRRYLKLAIGELAGLESADDRIAGARAIVDYVSRTAPGELRYAAEQAIKIMPAAAARADASRQIAAALIGQPPANLVGTAQGALATGPVPVAVDLALAVPLDDPRRKGLLEETLTEALRQGLNGDAVNIALGMPTEDGAGSALARIVNQAIDRNYPLTAVDVPALIIDPRLRALTYRDLGVALGNFGYGQMAEQQFAAAIKAASALANLRERNPVLAEIALASLKAGLVDDASKLAGQLARDPAAAPVQAAIGAYHADKGNEKDALDWLGKISRPADRDPLQEALGEAALRRDDLAGARRYALAMTAGNGLGLKRDLAIAAVRHNDPMLQAEMLKLLPDGRDRLAARMAELGKSEPSGLRDELTAGIRRLPAEARLEALDRFAKALATGGDRPAALKLADPADPNALATAADERDAVLVAVAGVDIKQGEVAKAIELAAQIRDRATAAKVTADAAVAEASAGSASKAVERVRALGDYRDRVRAFRSIAENAARRLDSFGAIASSADKKTVPTAKTLAIDPVEVDRGEGVQFIRLDGATITPNAPSLPDLNIKANDVRAKLPELEAGITDLSLARLNRFNAKFFEEIVGTSARDFLFSAQRNINPTYIFLSRGTFTLDQIIAQLSDGSGWEISRQGDDILLRVPLVIGPFATLVLSGAEAREYKLSASTGAFLVNAGRLYVADTRLTAYDEDTKAPSVTDYEHKTKFRPFITAWSDSETYIVGSQLTGFGYSSGKTYGLSFTSGPKELIAVRADSKPPAGMVVDSSFEGMLYGFYSYEAKGVSVIGNEYRNNIVYGLDPHDRSKDLRIAFNTSYGTDKKHGIIVSREVDDSYIVGNLSFANRGSGVMLDRDSVGNVVYANTIFNNEQDGVTLFESSCNAIMGNHIVDNNRGGIKIRNSWDVALLGNAIQSNRGAGIEAYVANLETASGSERRDFQLDPYMPMATFSAAGNRIEANQTGVTLHGATGASFAGNTFIKQTPRLYGGDLQDSRVKMLGLSTGNAPVLVASQCLPAPPPTDCSLRRSGLIPNDGQTLLFKSGGDQKLCVNQAGSVQERAFSAAATPAGGH